jgi:predicted Zn-dependent peptidase
VATVARRRADAGHRARVPYERSVLPSGLRVVTQAMPHARSVAAGLFVAVGSRHESAAEGGLSHLLEHLVFKGTRAYPAPGGLSEAIESVGGSVNASTDRELTVYSSKVPAAHTERALEVVSELVAQPLLRHADLTAEKPVIVDEIRMYVDSPSDHVFTMFDELLFGEHPLGREIAGTPRSVRRATDDAVRRHWEQWYRPEHVVLAVAGATDHATVSDIAAGWWTDAPRAARAAPRRARRVVPFGSPRPTEPGAMRVVHRDLSQGNLCIGMPGVARDHEDRWALDLLGAVLGDGMSSRLFLELRERRSLAYDVATFASSYADCGTFGVHAGFDPDHAEEVVTAIGRELERICTDPVAAHELERARAYTRGRLELRMEDTGAVAGWLGSGESLLPRILTVDEVVAELNAVTPADLLRVARRWIRPDLARLVVLGPFRGRSRFTRALRAWQPGAAR